MYFGVFRLAHGYPSDKLNEYFGMPQGLDDLSKHVARAIRHFADIITLPLKPHRRYETRAQASEYLAETIPVDTKHGRVLFYTNTQRAYHYPWFFHDDEPETLEWIDSFPDGSCFWDIGANIGTFSLYAALRPGITVLAFEPSASSYGLFTKNIEINRMDNRIAAYCLAFSERTELNTLNMEETEAGHSMHGFGTSINAYDQPINIRFQQAAIGYSIDDFVASFHPPLPTHIKLDVDGIEADIIRGAAVLLGSSTLKSVLVEVMGDLTAPRNKEIIDLVEAANFVAQPKLSSAARNIVFRR
ncbi:MAG: FkbM family methyltransferase [Alphaproteobacteria bacterium]